MKANKKNEKYKYTENKQNISCDNQAANRKSLIPSDRGEFKPVEAPLTAELAKMKIRARSTSHDLKKQELYVMRKLRLPIGAGSP